jgi:hypothetical protein
MKNQDKNSCLFEIHNTTDRYFFIVLSPDFFIHVCWTVKRVLASGLMNRLGKPVLRKFAIK